VDFMSSIMDSGTTEDDMDLVEHLLYNRKTVHKPTNVKDKKQPGYVKEVQVLEMLLVQYIFLNDDEKISFKEKMILKKYYHKFRGLFSTEDVEFLNSSLMSDNMVLNIQDFIMNHNFNDGMITFIINRLSKKYLNKKKYKEIILALEHNFTRNHK